MADSVGQNPWTDLDDLFMLINGELGALYRAEMDRWVGAPTWVPRGVLNGPAGASEGGDGG